MAIKSCPEIKKRGPFHPARQKVPERGGESSRKGANRFTQTPHYPSKQTSVHTCGSTLAKSDGFLSDDKQGIVRRCWSAEALFSRIMPLTVFVKTRLWTLCYHIPKRQKLTLKVNVLRRSVRRESWWTSRGCPERILRNLLECTCQQSAKAIMFLFCLHPFSNVLFLRNEFLNVRVLYLHL